jgi:hypothetical protein
MVRTIGAGLLRKLCRDKYIRLFIATKSALKSQARSPGHVIHWFYVYLVKILFWKIGKKRA